ncbi:hypothetical protein E2C01_067436 [Portunus trituberculatus]|uniref:Uncharacterized protein n=1 Tax=Portunus trituberculatus TaxID=210409 RepID=A0A5B7HWP7_PORTR|nr:hypothetical protein [Portunus trituberculatus]
MLLDAEWLRGQRSAVEEREEGGIGSRGANKAGARWARVGEVRGCLDTRVTTWTKTNTVTFFSAHK